MLELNQCNLNGSDVALLMRMMAPEPGKARELELNVSSNKLEKGISGIAKAITENQTPTRLIMRMVEYEKERKFRQLLEALRFNSTIKLLDISKASLPGDAGEETCLALQRVFEDNRHLEEFDISGEHAHLEVARFGIGLNHALTGLKNNTALRKLRIEYQNLGVEGAGALAQVLLHNKTLTHIECEHNDINLQSYTILVNCLEQNTSVVEMSDLQTDREECLKQLYVKLTESRNVPNQESKTKQAMRKTSGLLGVSAKQPHSATPQDVAHAIDKMQKKWFEQKAKMLELLERNRQIALGLQQELVLLDEKTREELMRPDTADSESYIMEAAMKTTTPRFERNNPVDSEGSRTITGLEPSEDGLMTVIRSQQRYTAKYEAYESPGKLREKFLSERRGRSPSDLTERLSAFEIGPDES